MESSTRPCYSENGSTSEHVLGEDAKTVAPKFEEGDCPGVEAISIGSVSKKTFTAILERCGSEPMGFSREIKQMQPLSCANRQ